MYFRPVFAAADVEGEFVSGRKLKRLNIVLKEQRFKAMCLAALTLEWPNDVALSVKGTAQANHVQ